MKRIMSMVWVPQLSRPSAMFDQRWRDLADGPLGHQVPRDVPARQEPPLVPDRQPDLAALGRHDHLLGLAEAGRHRLLAEDQLRAVGDAATAMTVEACWPCQRQTDTMSGFSLSSISRKSA